MKRVYFKFAGDTLAQHSQSLWFYVKDNFKAAVGNHVATYLQEAERAGYVIKIETIDDAETGEPCELRIVLKGSQAQAISVFKQLMNLLMPMIVMPSGPQEYDQAA